MSEQPLIDFEQIRDAMRPETEAIYFKDDPINEVRYAIAPKDYVIIDVTEKMESHWPNPRRIEKKIQLSTVASFMDYLTEFQTDSTRIFASQKTQSFNAVIDYHEKNKASWCGHIATLKLEFSPEFMSWQQGDNKQHTQTQFAEFVEDHCANIYGDDVNYPSAATMLEVALSLEAKRDVKYTSVISLENGDKQFIVEEQTEAKTRSSIRIPSEFRIAVPFFQGAEESLTLIAKLRYRHDRDKGTVSFSYKLMDLQTHLLREYEKITERIRDSTGINVWMASAP